MRSMNEHNATEQAYRNGYKKGRAEAIKEFAERLKETFPSNSHWVKPREKVDELVQEMVDQQRKEDEGNEHI